MIERRVVALIAVLAACACATPPQPELLPAPDPPSHGFKVYRYPQEAAEATVVLVHGLGTNALVWDLPGVGGLAPTLWKAGFEVFAVDYAGRALTLEQLVGELETVLVQIRGQGAPQLMAVGHGVGGTALYRVAVAGQVKLDGLVQLSAPLTFDGRTAAFAALLSAPERLGKDAVSWRELRSQHLIVSTSTDGSFERTLVTTGLPDNIADLFYDQVASPMSATLLSSLAPLAERPAVQPGGLAEELAGKPELPVLIFVAPADGLAPPWQCDPAVLEVRRDNIERHYLTRANGTRLEYNHLDLLLHPNASCEIFSDVASWLGKQVD